MNYELGVGITSEPELKRGEYQERQRQQRRTRTHNARGKRVARAHTQRAEHGRDEQQSGIAPDGPTHREQDGKHREEVRVVAARCRRVQGATCERAALKLRLQLVSACNGTSTGYVSRGVAVDEQVLRVKRARADDEHGHETDRGERSHVVDVNPPPEAPASCDAARYGCKRGDAPDHTRRVPARDQEEDAERACRRAPYDCRGESCDEPGREQASGTRAVGHDRIKLQFGNPRIVVGRRRGFLRLQQRRLRFVSSARWRQTFDIEESSSRSRAVRGTIRSGPPRQPWRSFGACRRRDGASTSVGGNSH